MITIYRSARAESPHLGRLSFWTTSREDARWFGAWERRTIPDISPSAIYSAEIPDTAMVFDGTIFATPPHLRPEDVEAKADELRAIGIDWVLVTEGPIEGRMWTVAIYLGDDPVPAEEVSR